MNFKENIEYRESLNRKVILGGKLNAEEKEWLIINPTFNPLYDKEIHQRDIIQLIPNQQYFIVITLEHTSVQADEMFPQFFGITKKDSILFDEHYEVRDINDTVKKAPVRILGLFNLCENPRQCFVYQCGSGKFGIGYGCEYYDTKMKLHKRESSKCHFGYAMKKEIISESKVRYNCKHPLAEQHDFASLIFTVEWEIGINN